MQGGASLENDYEIWEKLKSGDKSALSYVYFNYFRSMYQYGMKFRQDQDFIKDCIQDVFFRFIELGDKLGHTDNIRFYLFKSLKNTIYKKIETENKKRSAEEPVLSFNATFTLDEEMSDKEDSLNTEHSLVNALNKLSSKQREIIYLRYECEMKYTQICEIMQLKNDSARKLLFRAIKSLRESMTSSTGRLENNKFSLDNKMFFNISIGCPQNQKKRI